jgi:hypothetical protein
VYTVLHQKYSTAAVDSSDAAVAVPAMAAPAVTTPTIVTMTTAASDTASPVPVDREKATGSTYV